MREFAVHDKNTIVKIRQKYMIAKPAPAGLAPALTGLLVFRHRKEEADHAGKNIS
jgi:hypothetical protein